MFFCVAPCFVRLGVVYSFIYVYGKESGDSVCVYVCADGIDLDVRVINIIAFGFEGLLFCFGARAFL